jgi:hypothetical protein
MANYSELEIQRLLCAIYEKPHEKALDAVATWCYERSEGGALGFVGDRASGLRSRSVRARARWRVLRG